MGKIMTAALICAAFAACDKKKPPEQIPQPKAEAPAAAASAAAPAASTAPVVEQNLLKAPGNYLKTTVGQIQKAKDAKAIYEDSAKKSMDSLDLNNTGGN